LLVEVAVAVLIRQAEVVMVVEWSLLLVKGHATELGLTAVVEALGVAKIPRSPKMVVG